MMIIKIISFFNWDSLHARLNSHYKAWNNKRKKHKKIIAYRKSLQKEPIGNRCLLILDLKLFRLQVNRKHSIDNNDNKDNDDYNNNKYNNNYNNRK